MLQGATIILKCDHCNALMKKETLLSGNGFNGRIWSDGKADYPMMKTLPKLSRCNDCRYFFWVQKLVEVDKIEIGSSEETELKNKKYENISYVRYLSAEEIYEAIENGLGNNIEKERYLRILYWHSINDKYRYINSEFELLNTKELIGNLNCLTSILDGSNEDFRIMKAEIFREMGNFDGSKQVLNFNFHPRNKKIIEVLESLNARKKSEIVEIIMK